MSLICGYKLRSNPQAQITWTNPSENIVQNGERYILDDGPEVVRLNISSANKSDGGKWRCRCTLFTNDSREKSLFRDVILTVVGK